MRKQRKRLKGLGASGTLKGSGHVYVALCPRDMCLKIGGTSRISRRLAELRGVYPGAVYVWTCAVSDVPSAERMAHSLCKQYQLIRGKELYRASLDWLGDYELVELLKAAKLT
jgi:T5orf172 domain